MKIFRNTFFLIFMLLCFFTKAQNLVPNYSLENIIQCTQHCNQFTGFVADWTGQGAAGGPLGYFTSQCPADTAWPSGSVPYNYYYGFQYAHTGVSYAGIWTFADGSPDTTKPFTNNVDSNARNYIETKLTGSLQAGNKYYVAFFVNLQNTSNFACSDMGAYFSNSAPIFNSTGTVLLYTPQVANNPKKQELTDTLNWMKIAGSFVAVGGEKYITIGNFKNDASSSIRYLGQVPLQDLEAYYYIDDVIVSPDSNYADSIEAINEVHAESVKCKVFPNPSSNGIFQFQIVNGQPLMANSQVEVYNVMGEKVYSTPLNLPQGGDFTIDLSNKAQGLYLYRILSLNGALLSQGKLIIQ